LDQGSSLTVNLNGAVYTPAASDVAAIHIRTHGGADALASTTAVAKPILAFGGDGNDTLQGGSAADALHGGYGNDSLIGGYGADSLYGDDGGDTLHSAFADSSYGYGGGYGEGYGYGYGGSGSAGDYGGAMEGGAGDDILYGSDGADALDGGDGNDVIIGLGGADVASGGYGNDQIFGGDGNDVLSGNDGDDTIFGDAGDDTCYGNDGADYIDGGIGTDLISTGGNAGDVYINKPVIRDVEVTEESGGVYAVKGRIVDDHEIEGMTVHMSGVCTADTTVGGGNWFTFIVTTDSPNWASLSFTNGDGQEADPYSVSLEF
jgi:Ca2+-binding RTX toxin-like protein